MKALQTTEYATFIPRLQAELESMNYLYAGFLLHELLLMSPQSLKLRQKLQRRAVKRLSQRPATHQHLTTIPNHKPRSPVQMESHKLVMRVKSMMQTRVSTRLTKIH